MPTILVEKFDVTTDHLFATFEKHWLSMVCEDIPALRWYHSYFLKQWCHEKNYFKLT